MKTETILDILIKELGMSGNDKGKNFFFLCPFHDEKTPSFAFEKEEKFFKCFSCQFKAKDIFTFWASIKKTSLNEAFKQLVVLGYAEESERRKEIEEKTEDKILKSFELITNIYKNNLLTKDGKDSLDYLKNERLLTDELIENFDLGTTISNNQLASLLIKKPNESLVKYLPKTNTINISDDGKPYDLFWDKQIIFPIKNELGQITIFSARKLENDGENKYVFSPNNELVKKSHVIYNYHFVRSQLVDFCYLVEGFFDVISLTGSGVSNCISLLGTSISREQIKLLKRLGKKIILFLDGDEAGRKASSIIAITLCFNDIECEVINSKLRLDPDEICRKKNLSSIIKKKVDIFSFVIDYHFEILKIKENPQRVRKFILRLSEIFQQFRSNIQKLVIKKISGITEMGVPEIEEIYFRKKEDEVKIPVYDGQ